MKIIGVKKIEILNDNDLEKISSGKEYISTENKYSNILNFYLNLIPGVSKKHIKVKYDLKEWQSKSDTEKYREILQTAEMNDMSWKELNTEEKWGVASIPIAIGVVGGGVGLLSLMRWITSR